MKKGSINIEPIFVSFLKLSIDFYSALTNVEEVKRKQHLRFCRKFKFC